jgi:hypothetical protein
MSSLFWGEITCFLLSEIKSCVDGSSSQKMLKECFLNVNFFRNLGSQWVSYILDADPDLDLDQLNSDRYGFVIITCNIRNTYRNLNL